MTDIAFWAGNAVSVLEPLAVCTPTYAPEESSTLLDSLAVLGSLYYLVCAVLDRAALSLTETGLLKKLGALLSSIGQTVRKLLSE
jgi:hypothetical protein